jgi:hypothetical protein
MKGLTNWVSIMTLLEMEQGLVGMFTDVKGSPLPEMKNDFRRLEAHFICESRVMHRHLCINYRASANGDCAYADGCNCLNREAYLNA